jgi:uncharacterized membrane protein YozB (DUF420 family)
MVSLLAAQVNLAFQTAVFALLAFGTLFMRKRKVKAHAQIMLAAVILNLVSFIAVMAPALRNVSAGVTGTSSFLAVVHGSVGGLALLLSVWVVGIWLLSPLMVVPVKMRCYGALNKKLMRAVLFLWLASLILGFILYATLYTGVT